MATSNNDGIAYEILPHIQVYENGDINRLTGTESVLPGTDPQTGILSKDIHNIIPQTEVYVRIYVPNLPNTTQKLPLLVYFHGGLFVSYTPSSTLYHNYLNALVAESKVVAVSVHYRRAPEYPLPVAYQDSWDALLWVASHCNGNGPETVLNTHVNFQSVFLAGDCAGGNIVHNLATTAGNLEAGLSMEIQGIVLVDPYFYGSDPVGSEASDLDAKALMDRVWPLVCPSCPDKDGPWINPIGVGLVGLGCSRVLVSVAEKDVLKDRGWAYFQCLGRVGWMGMVEIHEAEGEGHCFHLHDWESEKAKERMTRIANFLNWEM